MTSQRRLWKRFYFLSRDDARHIESAWASSYGAFGPNKVVRCIDGMGEIETNLSERDFRMLCRHADVEHVPEYVSDVRPSWESDPEETWNTWEEREALHAKWAAEG
jgi:hypothetical protein